MTMDTARQIEMYRALGQTLQGQGYAGMYLGYLPWPLSDREYQILREVAYPDAHARRNKRYVLQPREGEMGQPTTTPERPLPVPSFRSTVCVVISPIVAPEMP